MNRIDVHCHLLPGVDDGCPTLEESLACARVLVQNGYTHCFCTPHAWPNLPEVTRAGVLRRTIALQGELEKASIPLTVIPGSELSLRSEASQAELEDLIEHGLDSGYLLFDIWTERLPDWFERAIGRIQSLGLQPVLAHPERMRAVQDQPELHKVFTDLGVLLQGNLQSFSDAPSTHTRRVADKYLTEGRYFVLGSDTHNVAGMASRMSGLQRAIERVGRETIDRLTITQPQVLLPQMLRATPV
jgi:protein-tyrosine phosphatase